MLGPAAKFSCSNLCLSGDCRSSTPLERASVLFVFVLIYLVCVFMEFWVWFVSMVWLLWIWRVIQSLMAVKDVVVCHLFRFVLASIGGHPFRFSLRFDSFMSQSAVSCESSYGVTLTKLVFMDLLYQGCIFSFFIVSASCCFRFLGRLFGGRSLWVVLPPPKFRLSDKVFLVMLLETDVSAKSSFSIIDLNG